MDLHKHDKYSALLDGPRSRESRQLDEGLAESQGQSNTIEEPEEPTNPHDQQEEEEEEETRSEEQEKIDQEIRLTPVVLTQPIPQMSAIMTQTTTHQEDQLEYEEPPRQAMKTLNQVQASIRQTIGRQPPGGDPEPPNPRNPGGPNDGGPNHPGNAAPLIIQAGDTRTAGALPQIFDGSRDKADNFIEEVKDYLRLNELVPGFNSPRYKIAFTLTLIKGPEVVGWKRDMGRWLDTQVLPQDNTRALWEGFLVEFANQFQDTQREMRARQEIAKLKMKYPDVDGYIAKFEELARIAEYNTGSMETIQLFLNGLDRKILAKVMGVPVPITYLQFKNRAVQVTKAQQVIEGILGETRGPNTQN